MPQCSPGTNGSNCFQRLLYLDARLAGDMTDAILRLVSVYESDLRAGTILTAEPERVRIRMHRILQPQRACASSERENGSSSLRL